MASTHEANDGDRRGDCWHATALHLQRAGFRVTIVDRLPPGEGCSFGNAGLISPASVVPFSLPDMIWRVPGYLADPLGPLAIRWRYFPGDTLAPALPRRWAAATGASCFARHGSAPFAFFEAYWPLLKEAGADISSASLAAYVSKRENGFVTDRLANELREAAGVKVEMLGADELRQMEPALSPEYRSALSSGRLADPLNSFRLVQVLAAQVVRNGGEILRRTITGFRVGADRPNTLTTDAGDIPIQRAVIAAGAWSHRLLAMLGTRVPLQAERGYHVMLPDPGVMPRLPVSNRDHSFATTPMENGLRFAGTVEIDDVDALPITAALKCRSSTARACIRASAPRA